MSMKVISTELLIRTASEALFENNDNFETDIEHVIDFLQLMADRYGFEIKTDDLKQYNDKNMKEQEAVVRCGNCKYADISQSGLIKCNGHFRSRDWFCADGAAKEGR